MAIKERKIDMQIITVKELSELLKVKQKTLYQWAGLRQIPCLKLNGSLRFDLEDIKVWLESCKKEADLDYNPLAKPRVPERRGKRQNGTV